MLLLYVRLYQFSISSLFFSSQAIEKEKARVKEVDRILALDERKRPYNSMADVLEPTEEEMEAFKRTRLHPDDPMAQFAGEFSLRS